MAANVVAQQTEIALNDTPLRADAVGTVLGSVTSGITATVHTIVQPAQSLQLLTDTVRTIAWFAVIEKCSVSLLHRVHVTVL